MSATMYERIQAEPAPNRNLRIEAARRRAHLSNMRYKESMMSVEEAEYYAMFREFDRKEKPVIRKIGITHYLITLAIFLIAGAAFVGISSYDESPSIPLTVTPLPSLAPTSATEPEITQSETGNHQDASNSKVITTPSQAPSFSQLNAIGAERESLAADTLPPPALYRITCYEYTGYPTASGLTVEQATAKASDMGLDGFCAVSPDSPWYAGRKAANQVLSVEGHGLFLVVDCTADWIHNTVDLYGCENLPAGREWRQVLDLTQTEVTR